MVCATNKEWLAPASHRSALVLALWHRADLVADGDVIGVCQLAAAVTSASSREKAAVLVEVDDAARVLRFSQAAAGHARDIVHALFDDALCIREALRHMLQCYFSEKRRMGRVLPQSAP